MPTYIFEISHANPIKAYPATQTPGNHFDDDWFHNRIKSFEKQVRYYQKWQKVDSPKIQVKSSIGPVVLKLYNLDMTVEYTLTNSTPVLNDAVNNYSIYEMNAVLSGVAEGKYWPVIEATFMSLTFRMMLEPWHIKTTHSNTSRFTYTNSRNDFGLIYSGTNLLTSEPYAPSFTFRCEFGIMDFEPDRARSAYRDQVLNVRTTSATPARKFTGYVGEAKGVAPWVVDVLNRIVCHDDFEIDDKQYETPEDSKWDINRAKGYPMIGASIDLVEAQNRSSLQLTNDEEIDSGIIVAYEIEGDAFGDASAPAGSIVVNVEQIED